MDGRSRRESRKARVPFRAGSPCRRRVSPRLRACLPGPGDLSVGGGGSGVWRCVGSGARVRRPASRPPVGAAACRWPGAWHQRHDGPMRRRWPSVRRAVGSSQSASCDSQRQASRPASLVAPGRRRRRVPERPSAHGPRGPMRSTGTRRRVVSPGQGPASFAFPCRGKRGEAREREHRLSGRWPSCRPGSAPGRSAPRCPDGRASVRRFTGCARPGCPQSGCCACGAPAPAGSGRRCAPGCGRGRNSPGRRARAGA